METVVLSMIISIIKHKIDDAGNTITEEAHRAKETFHEGGHTVEETYEAGGHRVGETIEKGGNRVDELGSKIGHKVEETTGSISDSFYKIIDDVKDALGMKKSLGEKIVDGVKDKVHEVGDRIKAHREKSSSSDSSDSSMIKKAAEGLTLKKIKDKLSGKGKSSDSSDSDEEKSGLKDKIKKAAAAGFTAKKIKDKISGKDESSDESEEKLSLKDRIKGGIDFVAEKMHLNKRDSDLSDSSCHSSDSDATLKRKDCDL